MHLDALDVVALDMPMDSRRGMCRYGIAFNFFLGCTNTNDSTRTAVLPIDAWRLVALLFAVSMKLLRRYVDTHAHWTNSIVFPPHKVFVFDNCR